MAHVEPTHDQYNKYIADLCAPEDDALRLAREDSIKAGLPVINVSPSEGKLLQVLAKSISPKRILEIGSLGGYSAIWLARALSPGGKLITLELDPHHASVARKNLDRAGLASTVEIKIGPGLESLAKLAAEKAEPFDIAFIDADKDGYPAYLEKVFPLVRKGGLILADNTLRLDAPAQSGIPLYNAAVKAHPGLMTIIIPVLRDRGMDGLSVSVKL